ncbi:DMT family transporter [Bdellovibrio sp. HCB274]|uniref:DMT family transporter n=1 Tax=Bdellovibrio sp. HCB274 TaxID=3394361 RepID=UPI0039B4CFF2
MDSKLVAYAFLGLAIVSEVIGSTFLQKSEQFTKAIPTLILAVCYLAAFYFLSLALKAIPLGVAYGIWGSVGIALTAFVGYFVFNQKLDLAAIIGISLMISGVIVIQVFSKSVSH